MIALRNYAICQLSAEGIFYSVNSTCHYSDFSLSPILIGFCRFVWICLINIRQNQFRLLNLRILSNVLFWFVLDKVKFIWEIADWYQIERAVALRPHLIAMTKWWPRIQPIIPPTATLLQMTPMSPLSPWNPLCPGMIFHGLSYGMTLSDTDITLTEIKFRLERDFKFLWIQEVVFQQFWKLTVLLCFSA